MARIKGKLAEVLPVVKAVVKEMALEAKGKIARAPGQAEAGDEVQDAEAAVLRAGCDPGGLIDAPYRRAMSSGSEALSKSWTIGEIEGGLGAVVGNDTSYGPLVQDRESNLISSGERMGHGPGRERRCSRW